MVLFVGALYFIGGKKHTAGDDDDGPISITDDMPVSPKQPGSGSKESREDDPASSPSAVPEVARAGIGEPW